MPSDWFIQKVRARPNKLENLRVFWESAGWKVAMGMRSGQSFGDASSEVMTDVDLLTEAMSCEVPKETKPAAPKKRSTGISPERQPGGYGTNYKGYNGNQKGRQHPYSQHGKSQKWKAGSWDSQASHEGNAGQDHGIGPLGTARGCRMHIGGTRPTA